MDREEKDKLVATLQALNINMKDNIKSLERKNRKLKRKIEKKVIASKEEVLTTITNCVPVDFDLAAVENLSKTVSQSADDTTAASSMEPCTSSKSSVLPSRSKPCSSESFFDKPLPITYFAIEDEVNETDKKINSELKEEKEINDLIKGYPSEQLEKLLLIDSMKKALHQNK